MKIFALLGTLSLLLGGTAFAQVATLDNYASFRVNGEGTGCPAFPSLSQTSNSCLWPGMGNQNTSCKTANGTLQCTTQAAAPNGLGYWINTLNCNSSTCYNNGGTPGGQNGSYLQNWITSGTWNAQINRIRFAYSCSVDITSPSLTNGHHWLEIGTYVRSPSDTSPAESGQGQHYYQFLNSPSRANQIVYAELNRYVQHRVTLDGGTVYPEDPEWNQPSQSVAVHYYDGLTHFYFGPTYAPELQAAGVTCTTYPYTFDVVSNGADAFVSGITGTYDPTLGKYILTWNSPKQVVHGVTYDVRYSASSMRSNGWSTGTSGGTVTGQDTSPYTAVGWTSPTLTQASVMYFAIRPRMAISAISNTNPARITLTNEHFMSTGDQITISGVQQSGGTSHPVNGTYTITVVGGNTCPANAYGSWPGCAFTLNGVDGTSWPAMSPNTGYAQATSNNKNFAEFVVGGISTTSAANKCDLNSDGVVNSADVSLAQAQALGQTTCTNGDINGDGVCNVIDVQRVVAASQSGGTCRTGQ